MEKRRSLILVIVTWLLVIFNTDAFAGSGPTKIWPEYPQTGFLARHFILHHRLYHYVVYLPANYVQMSGFPVPVILFLHGSEERGDDGWKQTEGGLADAIRNHPELYPAIVVMPQIPKDMEWSAHPIWDVHAKNGLEVANRALEYVLREFDADENRIYLTGLSLGGSGAWELAESEPTRFAAVVPVAAYRKSNDQNLASLIQLPMWVFQGARDHLCPVEDARQLVAKVRELGGNKIQYTEYPDAGHVETWEKAYADPALSQWLFKQALPATDRSTEKSLQ